MKKILLFLTILSFSNLLTAQVKVNQNAANSAINTSSAFMDASSSPLWNGTTNQGKGMLYPRVDLVAFTSMSHAGPFNASNNPNYFDGLLVFNTATGVAGIGADSVFPGYYYYRNTTTSANGGHWVSLKGIKGDDGSIGPIGPQGVQGVAGNDGLVGSTGAQGPTGVAGTNGSNGSTGATGAVGPTGASSSSTSRTRIGFTFSTSWTCPAGVTNITVELWAGGGGSGTYMSGGYGGYIRSTIAVSPGVSYPIVIGTGGANTSGTSNGANGGNSSLGGLIAQGGGGGLYGAFFGSGTPGPVSNFPYLSGAPSYIPQEASFAAGGSGSTGAKSGYCLISY
jgi:hypothetical protein